MIFRNFLKKKEMYFLLKVLSTFSLCYITLSGKYDMGLSFISFRYIFFVILILAFLKDILVFMGFNGGYFGSKLLQVVSFVGTMTSGMVNLLLPKLILIESNYLDFVNLKFGVQLRRNWNSNEKYNYIDNLIQKMDLPTGFIPPSVRSDMVDHSRSMIELNGRLIDYIDSAIEAHYKAQNYFIVDWCSDNTLLIGFAIAGLTILAVILFFKMRDLDSKFSEILKQQDRNLDEKIPDSKVIEEILKEYAAMGEVVGTNSIDIAKLERSVLFLQKVVTEEKEQLTIFSDIAKSMTENAPQFLLGLTDEELMHIKAFAKELAKRYKG
jgi:hypothetical protein